MNQRALSQFEYETARHPVVDIKVVGLKLLTYQDLNTISDHVLNDHKPNYPRIVSREYNRILFAHYHAAMRGELDTEVLKNRPTQTQSA